MSCYNIMAVLVNHRVKNANEIQKVLTDYGCMIKVRLGLHETGDFCSDEGLIILQGSGAEEEIVDFESKLNLIPGVKAERVKLCS